MVSNLTVKTMKTRLLFVVILALTMSSCDFVNKKFRKNKAADTLAAWEAKQDSIKKAKALRAKKIEAARLAKEKAVQDSLQQVQEMQARNRYHVIIGSFKVPSNADEFQNKVSALGFNNAQIVESSNGFRMVSVAAFDTYSKGANEILRINRSREEPIELWVYERR